MEGKKIEKLDNEENKNEKKVNNKKKEKNKKAILELVKRKGKSKSHTSEKCKC